MVWWYSCITIYCTTVVTQSMMQPCNWDKGIFYCVPELLMYYSLSENGKKMNSLEQCCWSNVNGGVLWWIFAVHFKQSLFKDQLVLKLAKFFHKLLSKNKEVNFIKQLQIDGLISAIKKKCSILMNRNGVINLQDKANLEFVWSLCYPNLLTVFSSFIIKWSVVVNKVILAL